MLYLTEKVAVTKQADCTVCLHRLHTVPLGVECAIHYEVISSVRFFSLCLFLNDTPTAKLSEEVKKK